jgi:LuxR family transcriptional regulator, quorum-sensing system regulator BjaR1
LSVGVDQPGWGQRAAYVQKPGSSRRHRILDTICDLSRQTALHEVSAILASAMAEFGFAALGINGLPPPDENADPRILTESAPEGFRDVYIHERFYLADHICAHARAAGQAFRYDEAPYDRTESRSHERFMQALGTFGMSKGFIVPTGWSTNIPACIWLAGKDPNLEKDAREVIEIIALFAASKAQTLCRSLEVKSRTRELTPREREVLQWISAGKTSWEISMILGLSERAINKILSGAMIKLDAVTRAQAVVNAIRLGEMEL